MILRQLFSIKRINFLFFLCLFLGYSAICCASYFEINFFDVGQGNCVLMKCPKGYPLLVDCGSSGYTFKGSHYKEKIIERIAAKIIEYAKDSILDGDFEDAQFYFNVVITHGDEDHCIWLPDVSKRVGKQGIYIKTIILGDKKQNYPKKLLTFLDATIENPIFTVIENHEELILACGDVGYGFLFDGSDYSDNDASIVLKLTYGKLSCILTGDATKKTTDFIMENHSKENLTAQLLLASHHGAGAKKEECNDEKWVEAVGAEYIVLSSGMDSQYLHPRSNVVERYKKGAKKGKRYHLILAGSNPEETFIRGSLNNNYHLSLTLSAIYSTLTQGNIVFRWDSNSTQIEPPNVDYNQDVKSKEDCIVEILTKPIEVFCVFDILVSLNLSKLSFKGAVLGVLLKKMVEHPLLCSINLDETSPYSPTNMELIYKIIGKEKLTHFSFQKNNVSDTDKEKIKLIWDNRGLVL